MSLKFYSGDGSSLNLTSINGNTMSDQIISGSGGTVVTSLNGTTTISSNIVSLDEPSSAYTMVNDSLISMVSNDPRILIIQDGLDSLDEMTLILPDCLALHPGYRVLILNKSIGTIHIETATGLSIPSMQVNPGQVRIIYCTSINSNAIDSWMY